MKRWIRDRSGATSIEYAMIASLIAFVVVTAIATTGTGTNGLYGKIGSAFNQYVN